MKKSVCMAMTISPIAFETEQHNILRRRESQNYAAQCNFADLVELADTVDSKSIALGVRVQVPWSAP